MSSFTQHYLGVVMRFLGVLVAVVAIFSGLSAVHAQSIASVGGPRELPPASFTGQQYVDSRGCVFLKAGYGGQTNWVPRVNAQRKALCGFPPTFGKVKIQIAEEAPAPTRRVVAQAPVAPAPRPRMVVDPATYTAAPYSPPGARPVQNGPTLTALPPVAVAPLAITSATRAMAAAPYSAAAPARTYVTAPSGPGPGKIGCFISAPVAEVVRLRNGGTAVVCTTGDGGLSGCRSPIYPAGSRAGVALSDPAPHALVARAGSDPVRFANPASPLGMAGTTAALPTPPAGYKLAWTDDRLNPRRAQGTAAGQAAQDQVWTRDVPAKLVVEEQHAQARVTVSTKSAPRKVTLQKVAAQGTLVQVGMFGVPGNADGAVSRLAALGLPVAKGRMTKGGKSLQIVFAGPFASYEEAQAALSAARRAGFADAYIR